MIFWLTLTPPEQTLRLPSTRGGENSQTLDTLSESIRNELVVRGLPRKLASVLPWPQFFRCCNSAHLVTTRGIKAGEVIQASDLATDRHYKGRCNPEDWGWATPGDRSKVEGHQAKNRLDSQWHFKLSDVEP